MALLPSLPHEAISNTTAKVTYGASSVSVIGGLTSTDIAAWGGLIVALVGLLATIYYKRKEDRRQQALYNARMAGLIVEPQDEFQ